MMKSKKRFNLFVLFGLMTVMFVVVGCSSDTEELENTATADVTEAVTTIVEGSDDYKGNVYEDGKYIGEATGYSDGLTVEVLIENNLITSVVVTDHNENKEQFYGEPIATIPGEIVASQYPIVDSISGATMTSYGIMNAVIDALEDALVSGELPEALDLPSGKHH